PGQLIDQLLTAPALDPRHRYVIIGHGKTPARFGPGEAPSGPMRCRLKTRGMPEPLHNIAPRPHAAWDDAELARPHLDRALRRHPDVLAHVLLALGKVMMAVDALHFHFRPATIGPQHHSGDFHQDPLDHLIAVMGGKLLRPEEILNIGLKLWCSFC